MSASGALAGGETYVDVGLLLATCERAAAAAGQVIRRVQRARESDGDTFLGTTFKDDDPKSALTVADTAAQEAVMKILRSKWPQLTFIGEEDDDEAPPSPTSLAVDDSEDAPPAVSAPAELTHVPASAVCVFVDPLDGTKEFVDGRLSAVQTLIGVSVYGRAVAGAVGLPFYGDWASETSQVQVVSGIVGSGVAGVPESTRGRADRASLVLTSSAGTPKGLLAEVTDLIEAERVLPLGGVGNKVMALLQGDADIGLMHLKTSLWDSCATEAVLRAAGGIVTDLHGCPIEHSPQENTVNRLGVLASAATLPNVGSGRTHAAVCAAIRSSNCLLPLTEPDGLKAIESESQGTDIARDIRGKPLTAALISQWVGYPVESYSAPESSAARFMMCEAVRLRLQSPDPKCPPSLFYKRVVMGDLEHAKLKAKTMPVKMRRDVKSYQVEAAFLGSAACAALIDTGMHIARPYAVELQPCDESPLASRFSLLLEDFASTDGWSQENFLSMPQMESALRTCARMHSFFLPGSAARDPATAMAQELEEAVWPAGAYWQPSMQAASQVDDIVPKWAEFVGKFTPQLEELQSQGLLKDVDGFGTRLHAMAREAASSVHDISADHPYRTLIHGDMKSANIFLRETEAGAFDAALIDFQWSGWGLGATDLAYLIASSTEPGLLSFDGKGEHRLLDYYHAQLSKAMRSYGLPQDSIVPRATLQEQYETALLDLARLVVAYAWPRLKITPELLQQNQNVLSRCAYNKSEFVALWLIVRCEAILSQRVVVGAGA